MEEREVKESILCTFNGVWAVRSDFNRFHSLCNSWLQSSARRLGQW